MNTRKPKDAQPVWEDIPLQEMSDNPIPEAVGRLKQGIRFFTQTRDRDSLNDPLSVIVRHTPLALPAVVTPTSLASPAMFPPPPPRIKPMQSAKLLVEQEEERERKDQRRGCFCFR